MYAARLKALCKEGAHEALKEFLSLSRHAPPPPSHGSFILLEPTREFVAFSVILELLDLPTLGRI
jgi:hypothetical protein